VKRTVLCGVDGSPDARMALRQAVRLSRQLEAELLVVHVVQAALPPSGFDAVGRPTPIVGVNEQFAAGERFLAGLLEEEGLDDVERLVVFGVPAERLADLADERDAEVIVVGSRGRGAFKAAFLGSVSLSLIGVARRPVLVVPPGAVAVGESAPRAQALTMPPA
jgi:nucleotide-binding universal stress UspA family protein